MLPNVWMHGLFLLPQLVNHLGMILLNVLDGKIHQVFHDLYETKWKSWPRKLTEFSNKVMLSFESLLARLFR